MNWPCPEQRCPPDSTKIMRYMKICHFKDLLTNKALFFARATKLSDLDDSKIPEFDLCMEQQVTNYLVDFYENRSNYKIATGEPEKERSINRQYLRENTVINCWHIIDNSELLWDRYHKNLKRMAILSTVQHLKKSLDDSKFPICVGQVNYINTKEKGIGKKWIFNNQFFTKKNTFSWENELRAAIMPNLRYPHQQDYEVRNDGMRVNVSFDLIDRIYLSPLMKNSEKEEVMLLIKKYKLNKKIIQSDVLMYD